MVGGPPPQQQSQTQPPSTPTAPSAEEEALKRNTDCGAECEYRHSDIARVNPRDCWYWLNGNCLNPKCAFRHPPLDGYWGPKCQLLNSVKQPVACIFFQKGLCLKGDRCHFLHSPIAVNNKVPQVAVATTVSEPPTLKKLLVALQKQKVTQANVPKPAEFLSQVKPLAKFETAPPKNGVAIDRHVPTPPSVLDDQSPPRYKPTNVPAPTNGNSISRSNRVQQVQVPDDHGILNSSRDADEFSREISPGFDVLVDDELRESDYYHNEDPYGRTRGHEGRNLNPMNDFDIGHSVDYDSMVDVDRDMYRDSLGYDSYEHVQGQYAREQHRASSSERMLGGSGHLERRRYPRANSPDQIVELDLRHRLSKQRRVNGLRSVISHDRVRDNTAEDRGYRGSSRRDAHHLPPNESSVSSRLRGRIKLPGRSSSPVNGSDLHPESEMERGRNRGRLSPGRSQISTLQGRLRDRIKGRVQEDVNNEGGSFRAPPPRMRDLISDNNADFAAPKRLSQLKGGKNAEGNEQQMNDQQAFSLGKRKYPKLESHQQSESDLSFEGPKPLSEILKRKRATVPGTSSIHATSVTSLSGTADVVGAEGRDVLIPREVNKSADDQYPLQRNESELETEEGMIVDDTIEDHEPETFDQRDGESDYEQVDGEDYNLDEAENGEHEEYLDDEDDDGDDFAKKIGVILMVVLVFPLKKKNERNMVEKACLVLEPHALRAWGSRHHWPRIKSYRPIIS
ncbi:hypothetical protein HYC85_023675 [Camellia sinensis]|uniref:C3H1-type domain-containing protein n=1 Tax=Camellia sinensis TaxID=4442 RepID=A0A7J7GJ33_CAMSI|nr:hypothetical protein HYC85_023675 [Camellia sinensis]